MISRREFLKLAGLSTFAYSAGLQIGKIFSNTEIKNVHLTAFLPEEGFYINYLIQKFLEKIENEIPNKTIQNLKRIRIITTSENKISTTNNYNYVISNEELNIFDNNVSLVIRKNDYPFNCDIFFKDDEKQIYSPEDLADIFFIRDEVLKKKASVKLVCSFIKNGNNHNSIGANKKVLIESDNKVWDMIPLKSNYKNIQVKSSNGVVKISVTNDQVKVYYSTCRNKLCVHSGLITQVGESSICAPNKILIRIINA